jgi:hypothetical protein
MEATTDPIARAKGHAATMYPGSTVTTLSVRGKPVVLAKEANLIRLIRLTDLDAEKSDTA